MLSILSDIIVCELWLLFLLACAYVAGCGLYLTTVYLVRWYAYANQRKLFLFQAKIKEGVFFFLLEWGAMVFLHIGMLARWLGRLLTPKNDIPFASGVDTERVPVVLVHGFMNNRGNLAYFRRKLRREFGFFAGYSLEYGGPWTRDLADCKQRLTEQANALFAAFPAQKFAFVCHSLGGLLMIDYLSKHTDKQKQVSHLILIGTPIAGTRLAVFARGKLLKALHPDSEFIRSIDTGQLQNTSVYSLYSHFDAMVQPFDSCKLPRHANCHNIVFQDIGHNGLLMANRVIRKAALILIET